MRGDTFMQELLTVNANEDFLALSDRLTISPVVISDG